MPRSSLWTRWSDLFGLRSLPGSDEEARAYLRKRVALYLVVVGSVYAALYVAVAIMVAALGLWEHFFSPQRIVHAVLVAVALGAWLYVKGPRRTVRQLGVVDAIFTLAPGLAVGLFRYFLGNTRVLNDFDLVLFLSQTFLVRAVLVPSTAARTLALGMTASLPLGAAMTWAVATSRVVDDMPGAWRVIEPMLWLTISVLLTGLASRVIYGLRERVSELVRLGQYTLVEKLGEGGMGVVYRARHAMLRRPAALKLLPPDRAGARAIARFEREVNVTATLTHPHTVAIYDFGRTPDGVFYYVMEYLDGLDLEALVKAGGPQPAARVIHILKQVGGALADAHAAGLIHRDVKPSNIVLCDRRLAGDFAKVVDFGLVRELAVPTEADQSTADAVVGTPLYMAPEAISAPATIDARADAYALGAVAYFLLTGTTVFSAPTLFELYAQHMYKAPQPPSERVDGIPAKLEALILSCLAKLPEARPASLEHFLAALGELDDVAPWTAEQARSWWTAHPSRRPAAESGELGPLAVDLTLRAGRTR